MNYVYLILGFLFLIKGADIFVKSSSKIAYKFGIPAIVVGLTIVSIGSSLPEMAISVTSSLKGANELVVGNVIGSNIVNTLLAVGLTALVTPIVLKKQVILKDYLVNVTVLTFIIITTFGISIFSGNIVFSRIIALLLLLFCIGYVLNLIKISKSETSCECTTANSEQLQEKKDIGRVSILKCVVALIIGMTLIILGGNFVVEGATSVALAFGMSEKLVGLTVIAIATSLPEICISVVAATKGDTDIAIGNVLGSNIFNLILILALSGFIAPIVITPILFFDFSFLFIITIILGFMIFLGKSKEKITRIEGLFLISMYVGYIAYIIFRN